ncbi:MAG: phage terminase small subunit P27 family [Pseudomonadota bacterium]
MSRKGGPGRPRKPHLLLAASGGKRTDRHGDRAGEDDVALTEPPAPPEWLRNAYPTAVPHFERWAEIALMTERDIDALAMCAISFAEYLLTGQDIEAEGRSYVNEKGDQSRNPAYTTRNETYKRVVSMLAQFGLTPSGRATLTRADKGEDGPSLQDFKRAK